jgi:hypothetical protein
MQTLKDWYLARLRLLGTRQLGRTPMALVAEDRNVVQQQVLASSTQRSRENEQVLKTVLSSSSSRRDYLILVSTIVIGSGVLLVLAFL